MKQLHNIRIRYIGSDKEEIKTLFDTIKQDAGYKAEDAKITMRHDDEGNDELWLGEIWIDHQQPIRKVLALLQEKLSPNDKEELRKHATKHIDTATHCFLRLDAEKLREGQYQLTTTQGSVHARLNIAAFPATKENAVKIMQTLF